MLPVSTYQILGLPLKQVLKWLLVDSIVHWWLKTRNTLSFRSFLSCLVCTCTFSVSEHQFQKVQIYTSALTHWSPNSWADTLPASCGEALSSWRDRHFPQELVWDENNKIIVHYILIMGCNRLTLYKGVLCKYTYNKYKMSICKLTNIFQSSI